MSDLKPCVVLLAAGLSKRFGGNKLCYRLNSGVPIIIAAYNNLSKVIKDIVVVVNSEDNKVQLLLDSYNIAYVRVSNASAGMGVSIAFGIKQCENANGWLIALADMPCIKPETIEKVSTKIMENKELVIPFYQGQQGHPVAFNQQLYPSFLKLKGDFGGKNIILENQSILTAIDVNDPGCVFDIDTKDDLLTI